MQHFCPAIQAYNDRHYMLRRDITAAEESIQKMVQGKSSSKKRALLGIVGRFAKSLFGVSTEEDTWARFHKGILSP